MTIEIGIETLHGVGWFMLGVPMAIIAAFAFCAIHDHESLVLAAIVAVIIAYVTLSVWMVQYGS